MKKALIFIGSPRKDGNPKCVLKDDLVDIYESLKGLGLMHFKTLVACRAFKKDSTKNNQRVLRRAYKIGQRIQ